MTPRQTEIRELVAKAIALKPGIRPELADHLIAAGASPVNAGSALFGLVCGSQTVKGDGLDTSGAFLPSGNPFSCTASADVSIGDIETTAARN